MKALVFHGPGHVELDEWQEPQIQPGHVLLEVAGCGICGTDLHVYRGMPATWPVPGVRGHEFAGRVLAKAEDVEEFQEGDRVVVQPLVYCGRCRPCRAGRTNLCSNMYLIGGEKPGGYAKRVAVPAHKLFRLPDNLGFEHAVLVETLATPVHAFEQNITGMMRSVAILGAGIQGLFATQLARLAGVKLIAVSDVIPRRLEIAQALGATRIFNANTDNPVEGVIEMTDGEGVDLVIEAAGLRTTRQQAVQILRPGGTAVFLALGMEQTPIDFMSVVPRELHLRGTQCYIDADFVRAIELLAGGDIIVEPIITSLPLEQGPAAFEMLVNRPTEAVKVVLVP